MRRFRCVLCFFLVAISVNFARGNGSSEVEARLSQLERKVSALENEVRSLKDSRNCNKGLADDSEEEVEPIVEATQETEIKVLEVRREILPSGRLFAVRYWSDGKHPVITEWYDRSTKEFLPSEQVEVDPNHESGPGVSETRVITQSTTDAVGVTIYDVLSWVYLDLSNGVTGQVESDLPETTLSMTPPGEIVYEPGKDAEVTFRQSSDGYMGSYFFLIDPDTGRLNASRKPMKGFVEPRGNETELLGVKETDAVFRTSEYPTRGVILLYVGRSTEGEGRDESMVTWSLRGKVIGLRAMNQPHPLPEGFLQIVVLELGGKTENGVYRLQCESSTAAYPDPGPCYLECDGFGPDISDLTMYKVLPGGGREEVRSRSSRAGEYMLIVHGSPKSEKKSEKQSYYCEATDRLHGKSERKWMEVEFYTPIHILREESGATWLNDTTLELKCVASGSEKPDVQLSLLTSRYNETLPVVVEEGDDGKFVAVAFVTVDELGSDEIVPGEWSAWCFVQPGNFFFIPVPNPPDARSINS